MNQQSREQTQTVVDSYSTNKEAWEQAHVFAQMLKDRGLASAMGVTVKAADGVWWVILIKRG